MPDTNYFGAPRRRAPRYGLVQERNVVAVLRPRVRQFDSWLKEAAFINAATLARSLTSEERDHLYARALELKSEVGEAFAAFKSETASLSKASRVQALTRSYERLIEMLPSAPGSDPRSRGDAAQLPDHLMYPS